GDAAVQASRAGQHLHPQVRLVGQVPDADGHSALTGIRPSRFVRSYKADTRDCADQTLFAATRCHYRHPMTDDSSVARGGAADADSHLTLKRGFTFRSAFSLAFADVSPIVALYTVFSIIVALAGLGFWWAFPIVLGGQLL